MGAMVRGSKRTRVPPICMLAALAAGAGCGTTEESGRIGDTLSAKGLRVTIERVDTSVPVTEGDVTGLSRPTPGAKLVGALVRVCSEHGGAIGPYDFGVETTSGDRGELKYPQRSYRRSFESVRDRCGGGWVVFEIPRRSDPGSVSFAFEDTGTARDRSNEVDARFSWTVAEGA